MTFIPYGGPVYRWAVNTRPLYRYILTGGGAAVCALMYAYGVYFPVEERLKLYGQQIAQLHKQSFDNVVMTRSSDQVAHTISSMHNEIASLKTTQLRTQEINTFVLNQLHAAGLTLVNYTVEGGVNKQWYTTVAARLETQGTMNAAIKFFDAIKNSQRMIHCKQSSMTRTEGERFAVVCELRIASLV